jgi:putative redox protein
MVLTKVSGELKEGYTVVNTSRGHQWISDQPKESEGLNLGPKPTELLLSSLLSCKLITMQVYAERKGWNLNGIKIHLEIIGTEKKTIIEKRIEFTSNHSIDQQKRLTYISGKCTIAKMLSSSIEFKLL